MAFDILWLQYSCTVYTIKESSIYFLNFLTEQYLNTSVVEDIVLTGTIFFSQGSLHSAQEVKKWIPSIKKELDYCLEVNRLIFETVMYPDSRPICSFYCDGTLENGQRKTLKIDLFNLTLLNVSENFSLQRVDCLQ